MEMRPGGVQAHSTETTSPSSSTPNQEQLLVCQNPGTMKTFDVSRHAAVSPDDCREMEKKYGWELIEIEELPPSTNQVFEVDCVFRGKTEFPKAFYEKEE